MASKVDGWFNRQKDIGWGYALAHWLPFVFLYYSITRRTITPFLFGLLGGISIGFLTSIILSVYKPNITEEDTGGFVSLALIVANPFLTKKGIDQSREFAKRKLDLGLKKRKITKSE